MAYKVRQGDSWQSLQTQYPEIQSLNPTIRTPRPGMVLQTPFQYKPAGGIPPVNQTPPLITPTVGGRGSQPGGSNPGGAPTNSFDTRFDAQKGDTSNFDTRFAYQKSAPPVLVAPPSNIPSTIGGRPQYRGGYGGGVVGPLAETLADSILNSWKNASTSYKPPAKGEPGYGAMMFAMRRMNRRRGNRNPMAKPGDVRNDTGDNGGFGEFNWRI